MPRPQERDENSVLISKLSPSDANTAVTSLANRVQQDGGSAAEILAASAELLAHFARSGLRFLPQSNDSAVAQWTQAFAEVGETGEPPAASAAPAEHSAVPLTPTAATPAVSTATPPATTPPAATPATATPPAQVAVPSVAGLASQPYVGEPLPVAQRIEQLDRLAQRVAGCTRCQALASCRTQTVFGEGPPQPRFVFFGEGPGPDEDKSGRPFVDKAGQLLTKMIEAMRLSRDEVYLLNTVKCRAPGNRSPEPDEVANCREYFETQLNLLRPEYIVCLGAVSSQALLKSKLSIGRLRQRFHQYHDSKVLVIYHPSYLLRNPDAKKAAWADLQMLMKDAGL